MGMNDVVTRGTARSAAIPGINVCAKTGTAENYRIIDGKRVKLKDNSVFVCFAPMEDPKIAIAVVVENAGFGGTWAGPISSLMMEKFLNDTLRPERVKEVERIANSNLMPSWLTREQYKADSSRAYFYFNLTKDSSYIKKYIYRPIVITPKKDSVKTTAPAVKKPSPTPKPQQPKPAEPDSGRVGLLHRDEMWDNRLTKKRRSTV
jgi:penicillin-binding protein 2